MSTLSPARTIAVRRRAGITAHVLSSSRGLGAIPNSTSQSTTGLSFLSISCSSPSGLLTHGALRIHIVRVVAAALPGVEIPPGWTGTNSRTAQITHHEITHWVLSKGWGDEEKAAGSSSLLITTFSSSETLTARSVQTRGRRPGRPVIVRKTRARCILVGATDEASISWCGGGKTNVI